MTAIRVFFERARFKKAVDLHASTARSPRAKRKVLSKLGELFYFTFFCALKRSSDEAFCILLLFGEPTSYLFKQWRLHVLPGTYCRHRSPPFHVERNTINLVSSFRCLKAMKQTTTAREQISATLPATCGWTLTALESKIYLAL